MCRLIDVDTIQSMIPAKLKIRVTPINHVDVFSRTPFDVDLEVMLGGSPEGDWEHPGGLREDTRLSKLLQLLVQHVPGSY